jgi:hypothetical protein
MFYLGPFFNLLPVIAVTLQLFQMKMMTPPAADEQQEMQQKMMKYMMIIFGLLFYKVAAGLCLYFIASSLWSFAERKLLPKRKADAPPAAGAEPKPGLFGKALERLEEVRRKGPAAGGSAAEVPPPPAAPEPRDGEGRKPGRKKRKPDRGKRPEAPARPAGNGQGPGVWARLRGWWEEVLKQAQKK